MTLIQCTLVHQGHSENARFHYNLDTMQCIKVVVKTPFLSHLLHKAMPHHSDNSVHIIRCNAVYFLCATFIAAVYKLVSFFTVTSNSNRGHQAQASIGPISGQVIYMQRIKASRAVVAVASVCQRYNFRAAMGTYKSCVFGFSAHTEPS